MYLITMSDLRLFVVYFLHHLVDKLNDWLSQPNCHLDDINGYNSVAENHAWVVHKVEEGLVVLLLDVQGAHDQLSQAVQGLQLSALTPEVVDQLQDYSCLYKTNLARDGICYGILSSKCFGGFLEILRCNFSSKSLALHLHLAPYKTLITTVDCFRVHIK